MTLEEVCNRLDEALQHPDMVLLRNSIDDLLLGEYIELLIAHGRLLVEHADMVNQEFGNVIPGREQSETWKRFGELEKRGEEALS